jgi:uncharacterized protein (TIGR00375 family)
VATGDFTHPAWFGQLKTKLVPDKPGLFALAPEIERQVAYKAPPSCQGQVNFILSVEISSIYKKNGKTRKVHNLVFFPDMDSAGRFSDKLGKIGNIRSDGRPILGLDARDLLEIVLETNPDGFLIPAHIWTPWFSVLGSKSGFDCLEECFDDLADHIFAVETGLSSDPSMNWRVSSLDNVTLVSNSDAHSPAKLARNATVFLCEPSYFAMKEALKTGDSSLFGGTIEFFPEEGKYHLDGHRKCGVSLHPEQTALNGGLCPACGKPLTVGVLNRVCQLADRPDGHRPQKAHPFLSLIPLESLLGEVLKVGPASKKVQAAYEGLLAEFGPELFILRDLALKELERRKMPLLAEALSLMRQGRVTRTGGFDGVFGKIKVLP